MPPKQPFPKAAEPLHGASFDPWNSSSTGHQRPENNPGTGWRESRNRKLNSQFRGGSAGGERMNDTWGAGAEDYDEKRKAIVPNAARERAQRSVRDMLVQPGKMKESLAGEEEVEGGLTGEEALMEKRKQEDEAKKEERRIFDGVVVYVNGSTFPLISDHKLKHLLTEHGGQMSLHLGRRRVTHVIVGRPAGGLAGAGGGLAGGKLEKEIRKVGGCGVKFVSAEWVLESLKAGKRLPEARFSNMKVAAKAQGSVYGMFAKQPTGQLSKE
ncbi:BRCT domain-containing protein [Fusarium keratoplasticum]|nr:BRCT domain-containing protein [Fusarium keratoplasticum]